MVGRNAAKHLDNAAVALHNAGRKVGGEKGIKAARIVSEATLGRHLEQCSDACGHFNNSCVQGNCGHQ